MTDAFWQDLRDDLRDPEYARLHLESLSRGLTEAHLGLAVIRDDLFVEELDDA